MINITCIVLCVRHTPGSVSRGVCVCVIIISNARAEEPVGRRRSVVVRVRTCDRTRGGKGSKRREGGERETARGCERDAARGCECKENRESEGEALKNQCSPVHVANGNTRAVCAKTCKNSDRVLRRYEATLQSRLRTHTHTYRHKRTRARARHIRESRYARAFLTR